jgi:hypothetical protein
MNPYQTTYQDHKNNGTVHTVRVVGVDGSADGRERCRARGPARKLIASRFQEAAVALATHERNGVFPCSPAGRSARRVSDCDTLSRNGKGDPGL